MDFTPELLRQALAGDKSLMRETVRTLMPVVAARVGRVLLRRGVGRKHDFRQGVEDLTQEVFLGLFEQSGKALLAWDPARGLSLPNYVGLVAERLSVSVLRSGRRGAWAEESTPDSGLDAASVPPSRQQEHWVLSRDLLTHVLRALRERLSPKGFQLFEMLVVEELPIPVVCETLGMLPDAVYAWRSRLLKTARLIGEELQSPGGARQPLAVGDRHGH